MEFWLMKWQTVNEQVQALCAQPVAKSTTVSFPLANPTAFHNKLSRAIAAFLKIYKE